MNFIATLLNAAKSIGTAMGIVTLGHSPASIEPPKFRISQNTVVLQCRISQAVSGSLLDIAMSGMPISLYCSVETREVQSMRLVHTTTAEQVLLYDLVKNSWQVCLAPFDTVFDMRTDSACARFAQFNRIPVVNVHELDPQKTYVFILSAVLGTAKVDALDGHVIDLMYYWDYKRPQAKTDPIAGAILTGQRRQ